MRFATPYTPHASINFATTNTEESLTQQGDAAELDINIIVKQYAGKGGMLPNITQTPLYGDFTNVGDYRSMVETINAANNAFMEIPANIRQRFGNDPQQFIEFCSKEENRDDLVKMGLVPKPEPVKKPEPMEVRVVNADPTPDPGAPK